MENKDWKKATGKDGKLFKHEASAAHKVAADMFTARTRSLSSVACHLSQAFADRRRREEEKRQQNRSALMAIIDIIRFLARQNLSFRGYSETDDSLSRGNFLELVHFTARYNNSLQQWLLRHPGNVSWLSPDIQNELIRLLADAVVAYIVSECRGRYFSVLCDEVSDRSNTELLSLVVRYVVDSGSVKESVVGLVTVVDTTAANLCDVVVQRLRELQLDLNCVVAQCYDGASNMAGAYTGVQASLKELCVREPLYIHCWTHVLNLVIEDVVKSVPLCRRTFELLQKMYVLVEGSPKRHHEYMACLSDLQLDNGLKVLQSLSATRWAARSINLRIVHRCLPAVVRYLEMQTDADSRGLLTSVKDFSFLFGLEFLKDLFMCVNVASEAL